MWFRSASPWHKAFSVQPVGCECSRSTSVFCSSYHQQPEFGLGNPGTQSSTSDSYIGWSLRSSNPAQSRIPQIIVSPPFLVSDEGEQPSFNTWWMAELQGLKEGLRTSDWMVWSHTLELWPNPKWHTCSLEGSWKARIEGVTDKRVYGKFPHKLGIWLILVESWIWLREVLFFLYPSCSAPLWEQRSCHIDAASFPLLWCYTVFWRCSL